MFQKQYYVTLSKDLKMLHVKFRNLGNKNGSFAISAFRNTLIFCYCAKNVREQQASSSDVNLLKVYLKISFKVTRRNSLPCFTREELMWSTSVWTDRETHTAPYRRGQIPNQVWWRRSRVNNLRTIFKTSIRSFHSDLITVNQHKYLTCSGGRTTLECHCTEYKTSKHFRFLNDKIINIFRLNPF